MSKQEINELNYYKQAGENIMRIYLDFLQLSQLDYSNNQNLVNAVNLLRSKYPEGNYLKGIESPAQFKKMINKRVEQYYGILQTFEEKYNKLYEKIYFPHSVHNVYYGKPKKCKSTKKKIKK